MIVWFVVDYKFYTKVKDKVILLQARCGLEGG